MKHLYLVLSLFSIFLLFAKSSQSQTATTTIQYSGFLACGGCAVCGGDYWCVNTPGSYCGNTAPCQVKTFFDPVPAGKIVTSVRVDYYTASCEGQPIIASINGFALPMGMDGNSGCLCSSLPCMMTTQITANYPCGIPGYNYGGNNTFNLCSYGPMCINKAILVFTYVDPDVITPNITASGPLTLCAGDNVTLNAGTGYSSYLWNTGATSQTITVSTTGTYSVTVTSTTGCTTGSSSVNVTAASNITPTFTQLGPYCQGASPGTLPITSTNGVTGTWNPATINTSTIGTSTYTFTPNSGQCAVSTTMSVTINNNNAVNFNQIGPFCVGAIPPSLPTTSPSGVTGTWNPSSINTSTPGTTVYTFTPNPGQCAASTTMNITVNQKPSASLTIHGNISCYNSSDGSIISNITGGSMPYTYSWSNGSTTGNLLNIPAGTYTLTVTDANNCTTTASTSLSNPSQVIGSVVSTTPSICNAPGSATVTASGGSSPYTFTWPASAGGTIGATANNLSAGNYTVTVADQYGCSATIPVTISSGGSIVAGVGSINHVSCNGGNNGSITINITTGTAPFTINWGSGNATSSSNSYTINNLSAGGYNIVITDFNGCVTTLNNISIHQPNALVIQQNSITHVSCSGLNNGAVSLTVNGGSAPYNFTWNPPTISGQSPTGLSAGNYSVTVTDQNNCTATHSFTINEGNNINVSVNTTDALCFGGNGSATVNIVNPTNPPYSIVWQNGNTNFTNNNIPIGSNFGYTVTDNLGCTYSSTVNVSQPDLLQSSISSTNVLCAGGSSGSANVTINGGGTPPYFYNWSNGSVNPGINYLNAGSYSVTVSDFNGCSNVHTLSITEPSAIVVHAGSSPIVCGHNAGSATVSATGGVSPYSFIWSNGMGGANISNLFAGSYSVTVSDQNGCSAIGNTVVQITGNINPIISQTQAISCYGSSDGILTVSAQNAQNPCIYLWSNHNTQANNTNLIAGEYQVTITDNWGCTGASTFNLIQPSEILITPNIENVKCHGGADGSIQLSVHGGNAPYTYNWSNGSHQTFIQGLSGGIYNVTVKDSRNCTANRAIQVVEPMFSLAIQVMIRDVSCYGGKNGNLLLSSIGGTPPFRYSFNGVNLPEGRNNVEELEIGEYTLSVKDSYGCVADTVILVKQPEPITVSTEIIPPSCIGNNNGSIAITPEGGTEPYRFLWDTDLYNIGYFEGLTRGTYKFTIIDYNDCKYKLDPILLEDNKVSCIKIPDAFTPNGDGVNDTWVIENIEMFPKKQIQVFNRWGQELYNSDYNEGNWDGTFHGKLMPTGAYLYVIELFNGSEPITGTVSLVR